MPLSYPHSALVARSTPERIPRVMPPVLAIPGSDKITGVIATRVEQGLELRAAISLR